MAAVTPGKREVCFGLQRQVAYSYSLEGESCGAGKPRGGVGREPEDEERAQGMAVSSRREETLAAD